MNRFTSTAILALLASSSPVWAQSVTITSAIPDKGIVTLKGTFTGSLSNWTLQVAKDTKNLTWAAIGKHTKLSSAGKEKLCEKG